MVDIDYIVVENKRSGKKHISIDSGKEATTVCGIHTDRLHFSTDNMKMKAFWRSSDRCKNCERAAKR